MPQANTLETPPTSLHQPGYFDDIDPMGQEAAYHQLKFAVDRLIYLGRGDVGEEYEATRKEAMMAIHQYCDAYSVGTDQDGMQTRLNFARVVDLRIRNKCGLKSLDQGFDPVELVNDATSRGVQFEDIDAKDVEKFNEMFNASRQEDPAHGLFDADESDNEAVKSDKALHFNPVRALKRGMASLTNRFHRQQPAEIKPKTEEEKRRHRRSNIIASVGLVSLAAIVVGVRVGGHHEDDSIQAKAVKRTPVTATTTASLPTTTLLATTPLVPPEGAPITGLNQQPDVDIGQAATVDAITIEPGDSAWKRLEIFATGTSKVDSNTELQRVIGDILPDVAADSGIIDLGNIGPGTRIIINQENAMRLKAAGVGSIG